MQAAYTFEVVSHDVVALMDENGFDVAHLNRTPRQDGSPGFRTDDVEWQGIINALFDVIRNTFPSFSDGTFVADVGIDRGYDPAIVDEATGP